MYLLALRKIDGKLGIDHLLWSLALERSIMLKDWFGLVWFGLTV